MTFVHRIHPSFFTPDEAAQNINKCKETLIKAGIRTGPFSVDEIRGGTLKGQLIASDYTTPMEVINSLKFQNRQVARAN